MLTIDDRVTIIKAVRRNLGISLTEGKDIVNAAFRAGLGTSTATQRSIEQGLAVYAPVELVTETAALLLRLVPSPADDDDHVAADDVAQAAVTSWLNAGGADDDTVIPFPDGRPGSTLTVGILRRSLRSAPFAR
jgi:hypothetical protein